MGALLQRKRETNGGRTTTVETIKHLFLGLGVRLTQVFEKMLKVRIVDAGDARRTAGGGYRHVPVLLLKRR